MVGDHQREDVGMGPVVSLSQLKDVRERMAELPSGSAIVFGGPARCRPVGGDEERGAFMPSVLLHCDPPSQIPHIHTTEAFGPVSTVLRYDDHDQAADLVRRVEGSLVASIFLLHPRRD